MAAATSADLPGRPHPRRAVHGHHGPRARRYDAAEDRATRAGRSRTGGVRPAAGSGGAVPSAEPIAAEALRTIPPRETAGQRGHQAATSAGAASSSPSSREGALFSAGDAHFAQGDCEICGTAIEMAATLHAPLRAAQGRGRERGAFAGPRFSREGYAVSARAPSPRRFYATTGMSVTATARTGPRT